MAERNSSLQGSFGRAFSAAHDAGEDSFVWNGKTYSTQRSDQSESEARKRSLNVRGIAKGSSNPKVYASGLEEKYGIPAGDFTALVGHESGWDQNAVSQKGAVGLAQLMPDTARQLKVDPQDWKQNLEGGARYYAQLLDRFDGDRSKAIAAYNAGPGVVERGGRLPKETRALVDKVLSSVSSPPAVSSVVGEVNRPLAGLSLLTPPGVAGMLSPVQAGMLSGAHEALIGALRPGVEAAQKLAYGDNPPDIGNQLDAAHQAVVGALASGSQGAVDWATRKASDYTLSDKLGIPRGILDPRAYLNWIQGRTFTQMPVNPWPSGRIASGIVRSK